MAIPQIYESNTFAQWLATTQALVIKENALEDTANLIYQTANNTVNVYNNTVTYHVNTVGFFANTVNTYNNTVTYHLNTVSYFANTVNTYNNTVMTYNETANTYANTVVLYELIFDSVNTAVNLANQATEAANLALDSLVDIIDDNSSDNVMLIAMVTSNTGLANAVHVSSDKMTFDVNTGQLNIVNMNVTENVKVNDNVVVDTDRNLTANSGYFFGNTDIKIPSGTTSQRPSTPSNGSFRLNETTGKYEGYKNGAWAEFVTDGDITEAVETNTIHVNGQYTSSNTLVQNTTGRIYNIDASLGNYFNFVENEIIEFVASNTMNMTAITSSSNVYSLGLPNATRENDVVIIVVGSQTNFANVPSGWTECANVNRWSNSFINAFYRVMDQTPNVNVSLSGMMNSATAVAMTFRGVDTASVLDATTTISTGANTGTPNPPAITTTSNTTIVLALGYVHRDIATSASLTNFANTILSVSSNGSLVVAHTVFGGPGSIDPTTFTMSGGGSISDIWTSATIALKPKVQGNDSTTITVSNIPAVNNVYSGMMEIKKSTNNDIIWPSQFKWPLNAEPDFNNSNTSIVSFVTRDGGNIIFATATSNFYV